MKQNDLSCFGATKVCSVRRSNAASRAAAEIALERFSIPRSAAAALDPGPLTARTAQPEPQRGLRENFDPARIGA
jgi:hypothetical protein